MPSRRLKVVGNRHSRGRTSRQPSYNRKTRLALLGVGAICALAGVSFLIAHASAPVRDASVSEVDAHVARQVSSLLAGIPQHRNALGSPRAPVTLQIFGDLECLDVKHWFGSLLPAIIKDFVRTNVLRLEYRSMETDTLNPKVFIIQQTAALAIGTQGRMWNFLATFYHEQGTEYTNYVTEQYLDEIAQQVPGLNLAQWDNNRTLPLAKTVVADNHTARSLGFHDTPAFRIGRTGGKLRKFSGRDLVVYPRYEGLQAPNGVIVNSRKVGYMNPLSLITAQDIKQAIEEEI
jgi:hypothetical protein